GRPRVICAVPRDVMAVLVRADLHVGAGVEVAREDEDRSAVDVPVAAERVLVAADRSDLLGRSLVDRDEGELAAVVEPGEERGPLGAFPMAGGVREGAGDVVFAGLAGVGDGRAALPLFSAEG